MADLTPMVKQYQEIKAHHQDAILFFRLGDFYEMFNEDAELASRLLDLTLTGRGRDDHRMPMCGIPYHAAENYIAQLIEQGYKVAICEQVEDPQLAQGVVKREVVKIITPGTVSESSMLAEKKHNYLVALNYEKGSFGLAVIEATTGEFKATTFATWADLQDELKRLSPAEIIISDLLPEKNQLKATIYKDIYDQETAIARLLEHFSIKSLTAFGFSGKEISLGAAAAILDYLKETQKTPPGHVLLLRPYQTNDFLYIDAVTRRNLELVQTVRDKTFTGSLLWVLDKCRTAMGSRLLRQWLLQPLLDRSAIEQRLDVVEEFSTNPLWRAELGATFKKLFDLERLTGKIATQTANARDLLAVKESLQLIPQIKRCLQEAKAAMLQPLQQAREFSELNQLLERALVPEPPLLLTEGGLIREGYHPELDELRRATRGDKQWIAELENQERQRTGIKSLKVGFTKVFGYYLEVTNANLEQVPTDYIRKQTLVNAERFITPELKEKEALILKADERLKELEYQIFAELRRQVAVYTKELQAIAQQLAQTDLFLALAETAVENHYCRPLISDQPEIELVASRHPVVEKTLAEFQFVPNNVSLDANQRFLLITGPNMGGKSTYMRQIALICLLAQMGSFVPAQQAKVGLLDRIFTRIGATDDIYAGQSTFMVEMIETANILNNATANSLVILDEIGRGTATFDGMAIAAGVAEYLHLRVQAKTLFATHYHEITQLAEKHPGMKNVSLAVKEQGEHITFLHKVIDGSADRSYGIQVANLAGLPKEVVKRAKEIYNTLEMVENDLGKLKKKPSGHKKTAENREQVSLF